jgi:replication factor C subunit 2/4
MTPGAQQALRRTMEIYAGTTRFALACNQSNKIIEAIQSRCAILRYARLTDQQLLTRLLQICQAENVSHTEDGLAALIFSAEGDMRQAVNNLQSTVAGFGLVNGENVFKVCDQPHPLAVQTLLRDCHKGKIEEALETLRELWGKGYSAVDIITTMFRVCKTLDTLPEYTKLEFIKVWWLWMGLILGNWIYAYEDSGGGGDVVAVEWIGGTVVQNSDGSEIVSGYMRYN